MLRRRVALGHEHVAVRQDVKPARVIESGREGAHLKVGRGDGRLSVAPGLKGATEALSEGREEPLRLPLRPILSVFVAMLLFVLTLRGFGLIVASALLVLVAGVAPRDRRWREVAISAVVLSLFAGFLFVYGLGLQAPLLPWR